MFLWAFYIKMFFHKCIKNEEKQSDIFGLFIQMDIFKFFIYINKKNGTLDISGVNL